MKQDFELVFVDTNVLIYQTFNDFDKQKYLISKKILDELYNNKKLLIISPQIIREFYSIATNSKFFQKPLTASKAITKINEFIERFKLVYESENTITTLKSLLKKYSIKKSKVHDINIVATMLDNNISNLLTFNTSDFKTINEIELIKLPAKV